MEISNNLSPISEVNNALKLSPHFSPINSSYNSLRQDGMQGRVNGLTLNKKGNRKRRSAKRKISMKFVNEPQSPQTSIINEYLMEERKESRLSSRSASRDKKDKQPYRSDSLDLVEINIVPKRESEQRRIESDSIQLIHCE